MRTTLLAVPPLLALLLSAPGALAAETGGVPLHADLGDLHHAVATSSPQAQAYFDQGLRLIYAFNSPEASRSFEEALRLDPRCAMCAWGIALAHAPHINLAMSPEDGRIAYQAIQQALALVPAAPSPDRALTGARDRGLTGARDRGLTGARDRAYVAALARRFAADPAAERAPLDRAYADAMRELAKRYPEDLDAQTLFADAMMNLHPWDYWTADGQPKPGTEEILGALEGALAKDPRHAGACHFYIHAVEAVMPEKALPCAELLPRLMPGAGHIVHMPAHVYIRVGRWADAIEANRHAVHADEAFLQDRGPNGVYTGAYYPHNLHFMAFAAFMAGRSALAIDSARQVVAKVPAEITHEVPWTAIMPAYLHLVLVDFGRWEEVLKTPLPDPKQELARGLAQYARGVALAATGRGAEAEKELAAVRGCAEAVTRDPVAGAYTPVIVVAGHALEGEIALRAGDLPRAIAAFERAREAEDAMPYDEPPPWYYPIRHSLGHADLMAGRPADAERVYREDLRRFPENGWSLYGLAQALAAEHREAEAGEVERRFRQAWKDADVEITASRF